MDTINISCKQPDISRLTITAGESWCFYGSLNSGIERFFQQISDSETSPLSNYGVVSFQHLQNVYEDELQKDDSDFLDYPDPGTPAKDFLNPAQLDHPLLQALGITEVLETGFRHLSSGQGRKLLLLSELLNKKEALIVYLPYDGLDKKSCKELDIALKKIAAHTMLIILVHNTADIPEWCSHLGVFSNNKLVYHGPAKACSNFLAKKIINNDFEHINSLQQQAAENLIVLKNGFAGYGNHRLFHALDLTVKTGEHTLITGPNGCGKSTLLHIISGDHPDCYTNELYLFGVKRGTGESIWDIKKHMGIITPELHRNHHCPGTALDVIISGLYDTIGLYRRPSAIDSQKAVKWLNWLQMNDRKKRPFKRLSYGEQRLILIARGLIKMPRLLILDEPTQGLDDYHRTRLLNLLEKIADDKLSTIIFVSHREDEHRPFFKKHIILENYATEKQKTEPET